MKRTAAALLAALLIIESPVISHYRAYALAGLIPAAGAVAEAAEAAAAILAAVAASAGLCYAVDEYTKSEAFMNLTAGEQEDYYAGVANTQVESIQKLYKDGYFEGTRVNALAAITALADQEEIQKSMDLFLKENGLAEDDLKSYSKKGKDGKEKKVFAPSGKLMDVVLNGIEAALGAMIADREKEAAEPAQVYCITHLPERWHSPAEFHANVPVYQLYTVYLHGDGSIRCVILECEDSRFQETITCNYTRTYFVWNGSSYRSLMYKWDSSISEWAFVDSNVSMQLHNYNIYGASSLLYNSVSVYDDGYGYTWPARPFPESFVPISRTEIVNNYFNNENIAYNDYVYSYNTDNTTNSSTNSFYNTQNTYLVSSDPAEVARDIIIPCSTAVINNTNSAGPDVDIDYINSVAIPAIITGINTHLDTHMKNNFIDMSPDDVVDFNNNNNDITFGDVTFYGLEKKFPFCLPFDLFKFFSILDAEPRAPAFTIRIPLTLLGFDADAEYVLDFSVFDPAAQVFRACEFLGVCIGLALATKKFFF